MLFSCFRHAQSKQSAHKKASAPTHHSPLILFSRSLQLRAVAKALTKADDVNGVLKALGHVELLVSLWMVFASTQWAFHLLKLSLPALHVCSQV